MKNRLKLRLAERSELEWINERYNEVGFIHSDFNKEIIAIAEFNGQKAGLGRLVQVDTNNLELGGMYVLKPFRDKGIAKELIKFLLEHIQPFQKVYCIPFEHLLTLYEQCGFTTCSNVTLAPKKILDKHQWCQEKYAHPTVLLIFECNRK